MREFLTLGSCAEPTERSLPMWQSNVPPNCLTARASRISSSVCTLEIQSLITTYRWSLRACSCVCSSGALALNPTVKPIAPAIKTIVCARTCRSHRTQRACHLADALQHAVAAAFVAARVGALARRGTTRRDRDF
eukprot:scaffold80428_cov75-Phaeocystis_antarctica.AAC.2